MSLRKIYYSLPASLRFTVRRIVFLPQDIWSSVFGNKELMPPKGLIFTGSGDFIELGNKLVNSLKVHCKLQPNHAVLDIGSGIGRVAIPLTKYLNKEGKYDGFDVIKTGIDWCQKHISPNHPNFQFRYIPLKNDLYRESGNDAADFVFPYENDSFDCVILTSVFTHMLPEEVENYLGEIQRVLKKGGKCFVTFFILNKDAKEFISKNNHFNFPFTKGHFALMDEKVKGANVAFEESYLEEVFSNKKLKIHAKHFGYWAGREKINSVDFQDVIILEK
jgi:ubiquinone/menaquinone biosynthesis C-methylase UbiE